MSVNDKGTEVYETLQQMCGPEFPDGAILLGAVVVMEWMLPADGRKVLSRMTTDPNGGAVTPWGVRGYLGEVLQNFESAQDIDDALASDEDSDE